MGKNQHDNPTVEELETRASEIEAELAETNARLRADLKTVNERLAELRRAPALGKLQTLSPNGLESTARVRMP